MNALTATAISENPGPCPGPIPTSAAHAERCRACGKCGAVMWPFAQFGEAGEAVAHPKFSAALALAVE